MRIDLANCKRLNEDYQRDGVVFISDLLSKPELAEVRQQIHRFNTRIVPRLPAAIRDKSIRFEPDGVSLRSCYYIDQIDGYFNSLGNRADFKDLVRAVVGWEPILYCVETFNKPAWIGTAAVLHQDAAYFEIEPQDMAHLWIALDDVTAANGAIRYWLGSHKFGVWPHDGLVAGAATKDAPFLGVRPEYERQQQAHWQVVPGAMRAGSAAIHSGLIVHDSPPNTTDTPRLGVLCGYRGAHTAFIGLGSETS
jgi:hypothetical protein